MLVQTQARNIMIRAEFNDLFEKIGGRENCLNLRKIYL